MNVNLFSRKSIITEFRQNAAFEAQKLQANLETLRHKMENLGRMKSTRQLARIAFEVIEGSAFFPVRFPSWKTSVR